jgi:hypothetical protein
MANGWSWSNFCVAGFTVYLCSGADLASDWSWSNYCVASIYLCPLELANGWSWSIAYICAGADMFNDWSWSNTVDMLLVYICVCWI